MKKLVLTGCIICMCLWAFHSALHADIYIKEKDHVDAYKAEGKDIPAKDNVNEIWVSKDRAAYVSPDRIVLYDRKAGTFHQLDPLKKTYVETQLPLKMEALYSAETLEKMKTYKVTGTVKDTGRSETIMNTKCRVCDVEFWTDAGNGRTRDRFVGRVWVYDIGPELAALNEMLDCLRVLANRDETYRKALLEHVGGVQMKLGFTFQSDGADVHTLNQVVEISTDKKPPAGIYSMPDGYTRKKTF